MSWESREGRRVKNGREGYDPNHKLPKLVSRSNSTSDHGWRANGQASRLARLPSSLTLTSHKCTAHVPTFTHLLVLTLGLLPVAYYYLHLLSSAAALAISALVSHLATFTATTRHGMVSATCISQYDKVVLFAPLVLLRTKLDCRLLADKANWQRREQTLYKNATLSSTCSKLWEQ